MQQSPNTQPEHDCGSYSCPTCGPELRAAVERCKTAPIDERKASEARVEIGVDAISSVVDQELVATFVLACRDEQGGFAGHTAGLALLQSGMSFRDIALAASLPVHAVVRKFTETSRADLPKVLEAERLLRLGTMSWGDVAKASGLTHDTVKKLGNNMGCLSPQAIAHRSGRGTNQKYTAEQIEQAYVLKHDQGLSYTKVAEAMGLKDWNSVVAIIRRNPRALVIGRDVQTVAA